MTATILDRKVRNIAKPKKKKHEKFLFLEVALKSPGLTQQPFPDGNYKIIESILT